MTRSSSGNRQPDANTFQDVLTEVFLLDGVNRIQRALSHFDEQWQNRVVLDPLNWAKEYLNGRGNSTIYFKGGASRRKWGDDQPIFHSHLSVGENILVIINNPFKQDTADTANEYNFPVLIDVTEFPGQPKLKISALTRVYCIEDNVFKLGESLLYRGLYSHIYKVIPRFMHREVHAPNFPLNLHNNLGGNMVKGTAQTVDAVPNDKGEFTRNGFHVDPHNCHPGTICLGRDGAQVMGWKISQHHLKLIDVVFGPLNL
jgi:hypothetical protein